MPSVGLVDSGTNVTPNASRAMLTYSVSVTSEIRADASDPVDRQASPVTGLIVSGPPPVGLFGLFGLFGSLIEPEEVSSPICPEHAARPSAVRIIKELAPNWVFIKSPRSAHHL